MITALFILAAIIGLTKLWQLAITGITVGVGYGCYTRALALDVQAIRDVNHAALQIASERPSVRS